MIAVLFITLIITLAIGIPVGFSIGISSMVYLLLQGSLPISILSQRMVEGINSFP